MTEIATIDWFGRWGTSVFSENTAIFSCRSYLPFLSYASLKKSECNLMHAISYELCMLGF